MLVTPKKFINDPVIDFIGNGVGPKVLYPGIIQIGHYNLDIMLFGKNAPLENSEYFWQKDLCPEYGVCDSPEQFLVKYKTALDNDGMPICVSMTHVQKDPSNAGRGGGWRWHKWGEYIGDGEPATEYLDDEDLFENGVWCFSAYTIYGLDI